MTGKVDGVSVARAGRWLAFERDPIRYQDSVAGDAAPHWKPDASRIMVRELADTALLGGESAQVALDVLLDIAFFRKSEASAEAEARLLGLYERVDLPLDVRSVLDRKLVTQCKTLVESSGCAVRSGFALPVALGYLALHADATGCLPADGGLRQDQRERLGADLRDAARLHEDSLVDAARMVTNEEVANSVRRLAFGSDCEWNVSADVQASSARLHDMIGSWVAGSDERPVLYIPICLTDAAHFQLLILERHAAEGCQATIVDTLGMLAHEAFPGSAPDATRQHQRRTLCDMISRAGIDHIAFYSANVQGHICNSCGPLICRLTDALQQRATAAEEDVRYAAGGSREIVTLYLNELEQREPQARQWIVKAARAKMLADQVEACRGSRFIDHSELTAWD
ncbi:hypothetical protein ACJ51O_35905 (plasmid) [Burkholderia pyrrocinia]|uniref:hypothetical protein n=1 Tax=Burkholderia pyrrocinia TaxID=60550 RepID=UPI0038B5D67D